MSYSRLVARPSRTLADAAAPFAHYPRDGWLPISLCPFAPRAFLIDLLAPFVFAAVVRQQLAAPATLRRLAWAGLVNGAALSIYALALSLQARIA